MEYKVILKGQPIGTIVFDEDKKRGDIIEFCGERYFVQYTQGRKKKSIYVRTI